MWCAESAGRARLAGRLLADENGPLDEVAMFRPECVEREVRDLVKKILGRISGAFRLPVSAVTGAKPVALVNGI
jgi:hypothetical protein